MNPALIALAGSLALFVGILGFLELGQRLGQRRVAADGEKARAGLGTVEGAVFALLGLLIAFTFSSAASRFETRRQLILAEANAIGTAWLRLDLLPAAAQPELKEYFRRYLDARLALYQISYEPEAIRAGIDKANGLQREIWSRAVAACQQAPGPVMSQVLSPINEMFDLATTRIAATRTHSPAIIFVMLGVLALTSSFLAGFAMSGGRARSWIHRVGFALIISLTVYVILDLEFPRFGLIRVDSADELLHDLRKSMN